MAVDNLEPDELKSINKKHIALRGSLDYKYPPKEACCTTTCGLLDMVDGDKNRDHRCVLARNHKGNCEFSWECRLRRR